MKTVKYLILLCYGLLICGCNNTGNTSQPSQHAFSKYQVVIDSGSKGNRVFVYEYNTRESFIQIKTLFNDRNKTPLAAFTPNPSKAGISAILPLLIEAKEVLIAQNESTQIANIPVSVLGTAGMRLLPEEEQAKIWGDVKKIVRLAGFKVADARTISGQEEGLFAWLNVNYLDGVFVKTDKDPDGIIEIGGASAQITFSLPGNESQSKYNIFSTVINGKPYYLYSASYLGLGAAQALDSITNSVPQGDKNVCYPKGYDKKDIVGDFDYTSCSESYNYVIAQRASNIDSVKNIPGFSNHDYVGLGVVYDALNFWDLAKKKLHKDSFKANIENTCIMRYKQMELLYPNADDLKYQCANATYIYQLLYPHLDIQNKQIKALKKDDDDQNLTWTLGYLVSKHIELSQSK